MPRNHVPSVISSQSNYFGHRFAIKLFRSSLRKHFTSVISSQSNYFGLRFAITLLGSLLCNQFISVIASQLFEFDRCVAIRLFRSSLHSQFISVIGSQSIQFCYSICLYFTSVIALQSHSRNNLGFRKSVSSMVRYSDFTHFTTHTSVVDSVRQKMVRYSVLSYILVFSPND